MALPRALAVAEFRIGSRGVDGPGCTATSGGRAAPCIWAVKALDGEGLTARAESQRPAVAGPKTAGSQ